MGKLFILVGDFFWFLVLVACFVAIIVFLVKKSQKVRKTPRKKNGFTLIEVAVVIVIIAILSSVIFLIINPSKFSEHQALTDEQICQSYKLSSVQNLPAMCLKYYGVQPVINTAD